MADSYGDIYTWLQNAGKDRVFRLWVYKKLFTPYEQEQKFIDESVYENDECTFVYIREIIDLNNDDYLIGFEPADAHDFTMIDYYLLSEIRLEYCSNDTGDSNYD